MLQVLSTNNLVFHSVCRASKFNVQRTFFQDWKHFCVQFVHSQLFASRLHQKFKWMGNQSNHYDCCHWSCFFRPGVSVAGTGSGSEEAGLLTAEVRQSAQSTGLFRLHHRALPTLPRSLPLPQAAQDEGAFLRFGCTFILRPQCRTGRVPSFVCERKCKLEQTEDLLWLRICNEKRSSVCSPCEQVVVFVNEPLMHKGAELFQ